MMGISKVLVLLVSLQGMYVVWCGLCKWGTVHDKLNIYISFGSCLHLFPASRSTLLFLLGCSRSVGILHTTLLLAVACPFSSAVPLPQSPKHHITFSFTIL